MSLWFAKLVIGLLAAYTARWAFAWMQRPSWKGWVYPVMPWLLFWLCMDFYADSHWLHSGSP